MNPNDDLTLVISLAIAVVFTVWVIARQLGE